MVPILFISLQNLRNNDIKLVNVLGEEGKLTA